MKKNISNNNSNKEVKDSNLVELMSLWLHQSTNGTEYLTGTAEDPTGKFKVVGFFNTNKRDEKDPIVRIYEEVEKGSELKEVLVTLWEHISASGNKYLTGKDNENTNVVAFYGAKNEEKRPYIRVYTQEKGE